MTIMNKVLFALSTVLVMLLKNYVYKIHSSWFGIKEEQVPIVVYDFMGRYKLFIITLNIVPYISIKTVG